MLGPDGHATGETKARADVHRDGDWHASLHVWVATLASGVPELILQRRSGSKDTWPDRLDVAVGGHVRAGETVVDTLREAEEEIGLPLAPDDVTRLGIRFVAVTTDTGLRDNEVQHVFAAVVDRSLGSLRAHPDEVTEIVAVPFPDALAVLGSDEMLPDRDGYYAAAVAALEALVAGRHVAPFLIDGRVSAA